MTASIIVTGAAGFVGSNLIRALNARGYHEIIAVDNLTHANKFDNLIDCELSDYIDKSELLDHLHRSHLGPIKAIFHQGGCSDSTQHDGRYIMDNNYRYSKTLFEYCQFQQIPLLYASSASVYGRSGKFAESRENERPLNVHAYSKFFFDQYVRRHLSKLKAPVVGLRYFSVYGQSEGHLGRLSSPAFHYYKQFQTSGRVKLFGANGEIAAGAQRDDFVLIDDVVAVNLFFFDNPHLSGIFNVGTGQAQSYNDVAKTVINTLRQAQQLPILTLEEQVQQGLIGYIDFPEALRQHFQPLVQADLNALRQAGYTQPFTSVEDGVASYCQRLLAQDKS